MEKSQIRKICLFKPIITATDNFAIIHVDALTIEVGSQSHLDDAVFLIFIGTVMVVWASRGSVGEWKMIGYELFEIIQSLSSELSILVPNPEYYIKK